MKQLHKLELGIGSLLMTLIVLRLLLLFVGGLWPYLVTGLFLTGAYRVIFRNRYY